MGCVNSNIKAVIKRFKSCHECPQTAEEQTVAISISQNAAHNWLQRECHRQSQKLYTVMDITQVKEHDYPLQPELPISQIPSTNLPSSNLPGSELTDFSLSKHSEHPEHTEHSKHSEHPEHTEHSKHSEHSEHSIHSEHSEHATDFDFIQSVEYSDGSVDSDTDGFCVVNMKVPIDSDEKHII
jgi:hypothetical protein